MRIALVHDYIKEYGGAERVLEALHEIWPKAPIYTLVYLPKFLGPHRKRLKNWDIRPIIPGWMPLIGKLISPLRLLAPLLFTHLDLTKYEVVIVSATGAYNPNLVKTKFTKDSPLQICYCHTPPRYLYGLPTAREWKKYWWVRIPAEIANHFLRLIDFRSAQKVDYFLANSKNVAQRIEKFYRRKAKVIYPPVTRHLRRWGRNFDHSSEVEDKEYYLAGGRLARPKRIDLAIRACTRLGLPLKVFGRMFAGYGKELKKLKVTRPRRGDPSSTGRGREAEGGQSPKSKVEFLGEVSDQELAQFYANCKAFIFPAEEEDFGITPVEAMAHGKPVIALRSGGVVESIVEGKTGVFFDQPTVESLAKTIKRFDDLYHRSKIKPDDCRKQARKFSKERFKREIRKFVEEKHA